MGAWVMIAFVVVLGVGVPVIQRVVENKRRIAYSQYALVHGLKFDADCGEPRLSIGDGFELFSRSWRQVWRDAFSGTRGGSAFQAFEFRYLGGGRGRGWHDSSVILWEIPEGACPQFIVAPEDLGDKILQFFGTQDFDFPEDKGFSDGFRLQGSNELAVRQLFGPAVRAFCLSHPGMYAAAHGRHLIFWREQALPEPAYLDPFFAEGDAFRQLLFK